MASAYLNSSDTSNKSSAPRAMLHDKAIDGNEPSKIQEHPSFYWKRRDLMTGIQVLAFS